jgi:hypothetical protein
MILDPSLHHSLTKGNVSDVVHLAVCFTYHG